MPMRVDFTDLDAAIGSLSQYGRRWPKLLPEFAEHEGALREAIGSLKAFYTLYMNAADVDSGLTGEYAAAFNEQVRLAEAALAKTIACPARHGVPPKDWLSQMWQPRPRRPKVPKKKIGADPETQGQLRASKVREAIDALYSAVNSLTEEA